MTVLVILTMEASTEMTKTSTPPRFPKYLKYEVHTHTVLATSSCTNCTSEVSDTLWQHSQFTRIHIYILFRFVWLLWIHVTADFVDL